MIVLHGGGMPKWLQYYIGGEGSLETPKSDYVICARPLSIVKAIVFVMTQHEYPWKAGPWKFKYILYICCHQVISNQIVSNISWTVFDVWNASVANTKSVNESATSEFEANIESYALTSHAIIIFNKKLFMFSALTPSKKTRVYVVI